MSCICPKSRRAERRSQYEDLEMRSMEQSAEVMDQQYKVEKVKADGQVKEFVESTQGEYSDLSPSKDLGSRIKKYWYKVRLTHSDGQLQSVLLSIAAVPKKLCPIVLDDRTVKTVNEILANIKHPYVYTIHKIAYLKTEDHKAIVIQPLCTSGSLKDLLYKSTPANDWAEKYGHRHPLKKDKVTLYGRQLLEAMLYLYNMGFPPLGHIQTGNMFLEDGVCRLGGYENTLLGYKTRLYERFENNLDHIDVIMFGHVIFEMSCAMELEGLIPTEEEYEYLNRRKLCCCCCISGQNQHVREVLEFIFEMEDGKIVHSIEQILGDPFFQNVSETKLRQDLRYSQPVLAPLTGDMKKVLEEIREGKPREQIDPNEEGFRPFRNVKLRRFFKFRKRGTAGRKHGKRRGGSKYSKRRASVSVTELEENV